MRAIITRPRNDGTYDEVGMNNRTLTKHYETERGLLKYGIPKHFKGTLRIELYNSTIHSDKPLKIIYRTLK
jgi:hypothetical protein